MKPKMKTFLIWLFAFLFTVATAVFQRMTGPTYPVSGTLDTGVQKIKFRLPTSHAGSSDAPIFLTVPDRTISGWIQYKRFLSDDKITRIQMIRSGDYLIALIPHQPTSGKVAYKIEITAWNNNVKADYELTKKDVLIRFRGEIPAAVLVPHILIIFLAMFFSTLTGLEALLKRKHILIYSWITIITLFLGGLVLGPIVQKLSFGAYWTGWPFGHDLTDNKSLVAFILWIVALIIQYRKKENRTWPVIAALVMLVVFLIPHSLLGSEIDYSKTPKTEMHGN